MGSLKDALRTLLTERDEEEAEETPKKKVKPEVKKTSLARMLELHKGFKEEVDKLKNKLNETNQNLEKAGKRIKELETKLSRYKVHKRGWIYAQE